MLQKHLFIMDPIEKLNLGLDTSLRIAFALSRHGQNVYFCEISDLFWESGKGPHCHARPLEFGTELEKSHIGKEERLPLKNFQIIHMRKDPPFDIDYITATWFLEQCPETLFVNSPRSLQSFNEKMGILQFPNECKKSLVSSKVNELLTYIENQCKGDAVLKPLHLYGGRGIKHIQLSKISKFEAEKLIKESTQNEKSPHMVQAFDSRIFKGEIRVFLVGGKALSWCLKVPKEGDFLANTGAGATLHTYKPSSILLEKVESLASKLLKLGIYFVGLDIIGDEVSEINITSPRLLVAPGDTQDYYGEIAEWLMKQCA